MCRFCGGEGCLICGQRSRAARMQLERDRMELARQFARDRGFLLADPHQVELIADAIDHGHAVAVKALTGEDAPAHVDRWALLDFEER